MIHATRREVQVKRLRPISAQDVLAGNQEARNQAVVGWFLVAERRLSIARRFIAGTGLKIMPSRRATAEIVRRRSATRHI
jgi:hypothetical protein